MKFCPNCGTQLADDAVFCTGCGTNVGSQVNTEQQTYADNQYGYQAPDYNQQQNYGYNQAPDYNQQPNYGYNQAHNYNQQSNYGYNQAPQTPQAPKKSNKKLIKSLISIALIIAIVVTGLIVFFPGPEAVVDRAAKAIIKGDIDKAAKYYASFVKKTDINAELSYFTQNLDVISDIEYKVGTITDADSSECEDLSELCTLYAGENITSKKAKFVELTISYTYYGRSYTESFEVYLIQYKMQWKILSIV